eukprot:2969231-Prymnesium_polylepis.1
MRWRPSWTAMPATVMHGTTSRILRMHECRMLAICSQIICKYSRFTHDSLAIHSRISRKSLANHSQFSHK